MDQILLLNGPNINLLGHRSPNIYGKKSLSDIEKEVINYLNNNGYNLISYQSNHEGELIDKLHDANQACVGVIFNPGGYSHTSIAIRDAVEAINVPVIEVHISNIHKREEFRRKSYVSQVANGQIVGLGTDGYLVAAFALLKIINKRGE